jgi:hypothetical protein
MGRSTKEPLSSKPLNPSKRAAVSPARTARGPALSSAARSVCRSVSGPDWATMTPRPGFCQRPDDIRQRSCFSVMCRSAMAVLSTPSCSSITAARSRLGGFMCPCWHSPRQSAITSPEAVDNPVDKFLQCAPEPSRKLNPWPFGPDRGGFAMDLIDLRDGRGRESAWGHGAVAAHAEYDRSRTRGAGPNGMGRRDGGPGAPHAELPRDFSSGRPPASTSRARPGSPGWPWSTRGCAHHRG